jgi:glycogen operon protein
MIVGGDEFLRSLNGNNNPYNLDTAFNWLDYGRNDLQQAFQTFTARLLAFRRRHPALRPQNFYSAAEWKPLRPDGEPAQSDYLNNPDQHAIAWWIDGTRFGDPAAAIYVAYNAWIDSVNFRLPPAGRGKQWFAVMDTSSTMEAQGNIAAEGSEKPTGADGVTYRLGGRAVYLAIAK